MLDLADPKLVIDDRRPPRRSTTCSPTSRSRATRRRALADDPDRPVAIIFTSGTTGLPKGALYCNRQLAFITQTDVGDTWDGGGRSFSGTSFAHLGFMTKLPGNLRRGGTNFIMERWRAADALELLAPRAHDDGRRRADAARAHAAPARLRSLRPVVGAVHRRRRRTGHARARRRGAPPLRRRARDALLVHRGRHRARHRVRRSRRGRDRERRPPARERRARAARRRRRGRRRRARSARCACAPPPSCRATGATRSQTAAAFTADGFVRTGDLGWIDDRGRLRLVGRSKEMYVRGGYNVYPVEVESVLSTHPDVAAVAIVPRPDDVMGEIGVAVVVPRDPRTAADARRAARLRRRRSSPRTSSRRRVRVVDALPLTASEKIDRRALVAETVANARASIASTRTAWSSSSPTDQEELRDVDPRRARRRRARSRSRATVVETGARPTALLGDDGRARLARAHRPGGARRHRARHRSRPRSSPRSSAASSRPGRCSPTVTQFVPAVRETATRRAAGALARPRSPPASCTGSLAIAEHERARSTPPTSTATVDADGDDVRARRARSAS